MKFFLENKSRLEFEWNSASKEDWQKIEKLFIAAYQSAYKDCDLATLALPAQIIKKAHNEKQDPLYLYFQREFAEEQKRIFATPANDAFRINYLAVKFYDQPIGFIITQLNNKSGRIYVRWNTVAPHFQKQGLGKLMLDEVSKFYGTTKFELYTRFMNKGSIHFYQAYGFHGTKKFCFDEPTNSSELHALLKDANKASTIYPPEDERVADTSAFIGFCKN